MPNTGSKGKRLVWRISPSSPNGEWVDPSKVAAPPSKVDEPELRSDSWVTSSFDLLNGTDVIEHGVGMTAEQFNKLFDSKAKDPKPPPK